MLALLVEFSEGQSLRFTVSISTIIGSDSVITKAWGLTAAHFWTIYSLDKGRI